jgi:hypothetical protein
MIYINGVMTIGGLVWQVWPKNSPFDREGVGVRLGFHYTGFSKIQKRTALETLRKRVAEVPIPWLVSERKYWIVDCDEMKRAFAILKDETWLQGRIRLEPEWEEEDVEDFKRTYEGEVVFKSKQYKGSLVFYLTPDNLKEAAFMPFAGGIPPEITESLQRFQLDHPNPMKAAFIMMRFGTTDAHTEITASIKSTLAVRGIIGLRADDKQYHDDLFSNILTYIYGCGFGVAVFERLESDDFNPNVSLEVGYMMGLRKPVCLVKDRTLKTLQSDLVGKLYKGFDPQHPTKAIATELEQWLKDKGL